MSGCLRISMWSGPRNISTATMYSFRQRPDTTVVDEPLYAHYLATTGLHHPGYRDVLATMDTDGQRVVDEVLYGECERPVRFYKNMAHHMVGLDLARFDGLRNILLTRKPDEMLISLTKEIPDADVNATGLPDQVRLLDHLIESGEEPVVLLAHEVLEDPAGVLRELCDRVGIPWDESMLSWPAGAKPEDGIWAPHWYTNVHRSTGFGPYRRMREPFPQHLEPLLAECLPLYEHLAGQAIRA
jgi:hypothetical protein